MVTLWEVNGSLRWDAEPLEHDGALVMIHLEISNGLEQHKSETLSLDVVGRVSRELPDAVVDFRAAQCLDGGLSPHRICVHNNYYGSRSSQGFTVQAITLESCLKHPR